MTYSVQSEIGQLRQAIVHRPGLELSRLTPRNIGELLFDDVLVLHRRHRRLVLRAFGQRPPRPARAGR